MLITVEADYSTFYLRNARLEYDRATAGTLPFPGLIDGDDESVWFIAMRQAGPLPLVVELVESEPLPLNDPWDDVAEFSITALDRLSLTGWSPSDLGGPLPVAAGVDLRGRYAVAHADLAGSRFEPPYPESYSLQLWPAPLAPAALIRSASARAEYWNFQREAAAAGRRVMELPEAERLTAIVTIAFRDHPESAVRIARGDLDYITGIVAYVQRVRSSRDDVDEARNLIITMARTLAGGS